MATASCEAAASDARAAAVRIGRARRPEQVHSGKLTWLGTRADRHAEPSA